MSKVQKIAADAKADPANIAIFFTATFLIVNVFRNRNWSIANIKYRKFLKGKKMSVKLRMVRIGRRHRPFFRINAVDGRTPRNGKILETIGHYDPIEKDKDKQIILKSERAKYWLDKGAIPTDSGRTIASKIGIKNKFAKELALKRQRQGYLSAKKGLPFTKAEKEALLKKAEADKKAEGEKKAETPKTEQKA